MNKDSSRRYQIWSLARQGDEPGLSRATERRATPRGFARPELYTDLGAERPSSENEGSSLYHFGLPIEIQLPGLCTLPNGRSAACKTQKISSQMVDFLYDGGAGAYRLKLPEEIPQGSPLDLELERIGKFHGSLFSRTPEGFRVAVDGDCKNLLSNRLAQLAAALRSVGMDETVITKPSMTRLEPDVKSCRFTDQMGTLRKGMIINVSRLDALIKAAIVPPVAAQIVFSGPRRYAAEVTRVFEIGFAVLFRPAIPEDEFSSAIKFID